MKGNANIVAEFSCSNVNMSIKLSQVLSCFKIARTSVHKRQEKSKTKFKTSQNFDQLCSKYLKGVYLHRSVLPRKIDFGKSKLITQNCRIPVNFSVCFCVFFKN